MHDPRSAVPAAPEDRTSALEIARDEARACRDCPLWEIGTQTVFGAGPADARVMFVGEAPGQQEDASGIPFVGPAGQLFDRALADAGIDRASVFVTNTVKHRPWVTSQYGRKKNRAPKASEIRACAQWLDRELAIVQPPILCLLGAVAAKRILGKEFRLTEQRGQWIEHPAAAHVIATIHPSFVLIQPSETGDRWYATLVEDLRLVAARLADLDPGR